MPRLVHLELLPLGKVISVEAGTPLHDALFAVGVEFPCGGQGRCKGCRIKVLGDNLPIMDEEKLRLTSAELAAGWRLACRRRAERDLHIELAQWEAAILSDNSAFAFTPQSGLGIAIDLGTTTIVAQLLDLETGGVLAVRTALNAQAKHGADIMSRVEAALSGGGQRELERLVRVQLGQMARDLVESAFEPNGASTSGDTGAEPWAKPAAPGTSRHRRTGVQIRKIAVVGNTVMHHLFCGVSLEPLSHSPFEPVLPGLREFSAQELGWALDGNPTVSFLPCVGGFVGSDILAGVAATKLHESELPAALIDLGTNGEIVVGNRERLLCASTAAGPAFEGARISMGMRAATGAISGVRLRDGHLDCRVLGDGVPRGICGSGLVDAVAACLDLGRIASSGRVPNGQPLALAPPVTLTQQDVRELQLAKGAIAAGLRLLLDQFGIEDKDLDRIYLAGAFGNYINHRSARRIGLLGFPPEKIVPAGNTALLGAKLALFSAGEQAAAFPEVLRKITHVCLSEDLQFQDRFVEELAFPEPSLFPSP